MKLTEDLILQFEGTDVDNDQINLIHIERANYILYKTMEKWPFVFSDKESDNSIAWAHWSMDKYKYGCEEDISRSRVLPGQPLPQKKDSVDTFLLDISNGRYNLPMNAELVVRAKKLLEKS